MIVQTPHISPKVAATIAALMTCAVLFSIPSFAAELPKQGVRVSYADLDLTSEHGVKTLNKRVSAAAGRICAGAPSAHDHMVCMMMVKHDTRKPVATAIAQATQQRDSQLASNSEPRMSR